MKKRLFTAFFLLAIISTFFNFNLVFVARADGSKIYLGGMPAGFNVAGLGAKIIGLTDVPTENGYLSPSKDSELKVGDVIIAIDGTSVNGAKDIARECADGEIKILTVKRDGKLFLRDITPALSIDGTYKLGVFLRDTINGIGTISFIKDGKFASLGHPVTDDDNSVLEISGGNLYSAIITGYVRGERGRPGELRGTFVGGVVIGDIKSNTISGVYGTLNKNFDLSELQEIEVGNATIGKAEIYSTISGSKPQAYSVSLIKVEEENDVKNFVIRVEDDELLTTTGGIVQGMSGSPIVQNGKLVGAVTHVFINDPKTGYGISVSKMLNNI